MRAQCGKRGKEGLTLLLMVPELHGEVNSWPFQGSLQPCSRLLWWEKAENAPVPGLGLQPCALPLLLTAPRLYCLPSCLQNKYSSFTNCQNKNSYGSQASPVPTELLSEVSSEPACGPQALVWVWVHLSWVWL